MPKNSANEIRAEYDLPQLKGGTRGKYYTKAKAGTNLVLIDPDLAKAFPDEESVNRALRLLLETASDATATSRRTRKTVKKTRTPRPKKPSPITTRR